jgi:hypothetical protein
MNKQREIVVRFYILVDDSGGVHPQLVIEDALGNCDWLGFEILADTAEIDEQIPREFDL